MTMYRYLCSVGLGGLLFVGGPAWTSQSCPDTDSDGICDATDPDIDNDGTLNEQDPCPSDNPDDVDGDAFCDSDPIDACAGSANDMDADMDGLCDDFEVAYGTDSNVSDTDGDGLNDGEEVVVYGTNPTLYDTDGGGADDGDEVLFFETDPTDPSDDAQCFDYNGDGFNDCTCTEKANLMVLSIQQEEANLPIGAARSMESRAAAAVRSTEADNLLAAQNTLAAIAAQASGMNSPNLSSSEADALDRIEFDANFVFTLLDSCSDPSGGTGTNNG